MQAASVNIIVGTHVWVEDRIEAWIDGEVTRINGEEVHVHTPNGKLVSHIFAINYWSCPFSQSFVAHFECK